MPEDKKLDVFVARDMIRGAFILLAGLCIDDGLDDSALLSALTCWDRLSRQIGERAGLSQEATAMEMCDISVFHSKVMPTKALMRLNVIAKNYVVKLKEEYGESVG